ncbi:MAG: hypothetical protein AB7I18_01385 [Candidatus Berkiella sp.]
MMGGSEDDNDFAGNDPTPTWMPGFNSENPTLNPTQTDILNTYFEQYLKEPFTLFITLAPSEFKETRIGLLRSALDTPPEYFAQILAENFPCVPETDPTYEQNAHFRSKLIAFNQLCLGKIDVNHELYTAVFDQRFAKKENSPTKHKMLSSFFNSAIRRLIDEACRIFMATNQTPPTSKVRKKLF